MKRTLLLAGLVAGSTVAGIAQAEAPGEHELLELNAAAADMQVRKDVVTADRLLADDYVFLQADGNVSNKAQNIAVIRDPAFVCQSLVTEDGKVRVYGDAAVITGRVVDSGAFRTWMAAAQKAEALNQKYLPPYGPYYFPDPLRRAG